MERKRDGFVALGDVAAANRATRRSQPCSPRAAAAGAAPLHPPQPSGAARRREGRGRGCWVHGAAARACSLPRANPGNRKEFIRRNGPYTLVMTAGGLNKLPYGNLPRRLLAWVTTEAVRTQRRELVLGRSIADFMRSLGVYHDSGGRGGVQTRLRNQMDRLFGCMVALIYEDERQKSRVQAVLADRTELWWDAKRPDESSLWESTIYLSESFFHEIIAHPVPLDMNILRSLKRSPLGLDLYLWLVYRTFGLRTPVRLSWPQIYRQFGVNPTAASDKRTVQNLRAKVLRELVKIKSAWPELTYRTVRDGLVVSPSPPRVAATRLHLIE